MASVACLGMAVWDRIFSVPHLPHGSTKLYAHCLTETGGGPAATASTAIVRLGGTAHFIGRVGDDDVGTLITEELQRYGVQLSGLKRVPGARSGWSSVAIDPAGERLIVNFPGMGLDIDPHWITTEMLVGCDVLLVDMGWRAGGEMAMLAARKLGVAIVLDADLTPDPSTAALVALADHVLFSAQGLLHFTGIEDPRFALERAAAKASHAQVVAVTLGEQGCLLLHEGNFTLVPAFDVPVIDTLGAGDVFHGAYALAIAEGASIHTAVRFGNAAAALKCTHSGGRNGIPNRREVDTILERGHPQLGLDRQD